MVENLIQAIAAKHNLLARLALTKQTSIDINLRIVMEKEFRIRT